MLGTEQMEAFSGLAVLCSEVSDPVLVASVL